MTASPWAVPPEGPSRTCVGRSRQAGEQPLPVGAACGVDSPRGVGGPVVHAGALGCRDAASLANVIEHRPCKSRWSVWQVPGRVHHASVWRLAPPPKATCPSGAPQIQGSRMHLWFSGGRRGWGTLSPLGQKQPAMQCSSQSWECSGLEQVSAQGEPHSRYCMLKGQVWAAGWRTEWGRGHVLPPPLGRGRAAR